jgi:hypothetical protein
LAALFRAQRGGDELTAQNIHALQRDSDVTGRSLTHLFATSHPPRGPCNKSMQNMTTTENTGNKGEMGYNVYAVKDDLKAYILVF